MKLSQKQQEFTKSIGSLIEYATENGYGLTFGDAFRDPRVFGSFGTKKSYSAASSCHKIRLAVDFNLFVNGEFIQEGSHPAWLELGAFWEKESPLATWGGRFNDANHFSFGHWGSK